MLFIFFIFPSIFLPFFLCFSAETKTTITLPEIYVIEHASFETLSDNTFVPVKKIKIQGNQTGTLDALARTSAFPTVHYGYPSGATGINLGGRSIDDTQVFTLGVPLNLPQGGGADLSVFPSFLWSEAELSSSLSGAAFSPQSASGSLQLKLWTREKIRSLRDNRPLGRVTVAYDRQLQNYSLASKQENAAILVGMNLGLQTGPAGSLSYYLLRKPGRHLLFHLLGTTQDGDNPGSRTFPTPRAHKKLWRVIPVVESHFSLVNDLIFESTLYGDLQELTLLDPSSPGSETDTRTHQFGAENALIFQNYTLAVSARYTRFIQAGFGEVIEWPMQSSLTRDTELSPNWLMKTSLGGTYLANPGFAPSAKVALKDQLRDRENFFGEIGSHPKMPTLVDRYYVYVSPFPGGSFQGNKNLKTERVNTAIVGYENKVGNFESVSTVKGEYRQDVQINTGSTVENRGSAQLASFMQNFKFSFDQNWIATAETLFTVSRLGYTRRTYPNLPFLSQQAGLQFFQNDQLDYQIFGKYVGPSTQYSGEFHRPYEIFDAFVHWSPVSNLNFTAGIENIFDTRADVVVGYPLPGRMVFLSGQMIF